MIVQSSPEFRRNNGFSKVRANQFADAFFQNIWKNRFSNDEKQIVSDKPPMRLGLTSTTVIPTTTTRTTLTMSPVCGETDKKYSISQVVV